MGILTGKRATENKYVEPAGRPYCRGRPRWYTRCTCERKQQDYSSFFYLIEEYKCVYPGAWGREEQPRASSPWSTIVCSKCDGKARVVWDPRDKGIKGIMYSEFQKMKAKEKPQ